MVGTVLERVGITATAFLAFLALFPISGVDTDPPEYFSIFGNTVPADSPWPAVALGVLTLGALEIVRRRLHRDDPR